MMRPSLFWIFWMGLSVVSQCSVFVTGTGIQSDESTLRRFLTEAPKAWIDARKMYDGKKFEFRVVRNKTGTTKQSQFRIEGTFEQNGRCYRLKVRELEPRQSKNLAWKLCNDFYVASLLENDSDGFLVTKAEPKNIGDLQRKNTNIPNWQTNVHCYGLCYPSYQFGLNFILFDCLPNPPETAFLTVEDAVSQIGSDGKEFITVKLGTINTKVTLKLLPDRQWCVLESKIVSNDLLASDEGDFPVKTTTEVRFTYDGDSCHPSKKFRSFLLGQAGSTEEIFFGNLEPVNLTCKDCRLPAFGIIEPAELVSEESKWKLWHFLSLCLAIGVLLFLGRKFFLGGSSQESFVAKARSAFTLIDLLVVIGIIGVLTAMLLPAVQMVRESGRRTVCSNNVKQLALGLMNFESVHQHLPMGLRSFEKIPGGGSSEAQYQGMSWITRILPFIEQNAMWENAVEDYRFSAYPFRGHRGMQTVLPSVTCPSDPATHQVQWTHEGYLVALTDYLGVHGRNFQTRGGVFTYDEPVRLAEIPDGQSNTLMIGERPPSTDFWYGWWYATGSGSISTGDVTLGVAELNPALVPGGVGGGSHLEDCPAGPYSYVAGRNEQYDALHFWSYHSGGANFALADGSVRLIPYSIGDSAMQSLATRAGGETIAIDF